LGVLQGPKGSLGDLTLGNAPKGFHITRENLRPTGLCAQISFPRNLKMDGDQKSPGEWKQKPFLQIKGACALYIFPKGAQIENTHTRGAPASKNNQKGVKKHRGFFLLGGPNSGGGLLGAQTYKERKGGPKFAGEDISPQNYGVPEGKKKGPLLKKILLKGAPLWAGGHNNRREPNYRRRPSPPENIRGRASKKNTLAKRLSK